MLNEAKIVYIDEMYSKDDSYYANVQDYYDISADRLKIVKEAQLGVGHFGKVYYGTLRCKHTNRILPVAVKMIKIDTSDCDENEQSNDAEVNIEQLDALRVELNTMAYIQRLQEKPHPNLIRLIGTTTTINQQFCLMTEYCEYGSLDCYLQDKYNSNQFINEIVSNGSETPEGKVIWKNDVDNNSLDTQAQFFDHITTCDLLSFAEQIASAMQFLSSRNILHRDVALRNIFLKANMLIKLGDFGLSRKLIEGNKTYLSTKIAEIPVLYTALESLIKKHYTVESEVWTFGVVLWELFTFGQHTPYEEEIPHFTIAILKRFLINGGRLKPPDTAPRPIQALMSACWSDNINTRPNFQTCQSTIHSVLIDARKTKSKLNMIEPEQTIVKNVSHAKKKKTKIALLCSIATFIIVSLTAITLWSLTILSSANNVSKNKKQGIPNWCIQKDYKLNDIKIVNDEWYIQDNITLSKNLPQLGWENFVKNQDTLFVRNDKLILRAFRHNGTYYSARLRSKQAYSPSIHDGRKIRYEITAKVPTMDGTCPRFFLYGDTEMYGDFPSRGMIGIMGWSHLLENNYISKLIWRTEDEYQAHFALERHNMSSQFYRYAVELSNQRQDGAYVRFDRNKVNVDNRVFGTTISSDEWIWSNFSSCNRTYDADANQCSFLAPFDNPMNLVIEIYIGGVWCGANVRKSDYNVLDYGVEMEISKIVVSALYFDTCSSEQ